MYHYIWFSVNKSPRADRGNKRTHRVDEGARALNEDLFPWTNFFQASAKRNTYVLARISLIPLTSLIPLILEISKQGNIVVLAAKRCFQFQRFKRLKTPISMRLGSILINYAKPYNSIAYCLHKGTTLAEHATLNTPLGLWAPIGTPREVRKRRSTARLLLKNPPHS